MLTGPWKGMFPAEHLAGAQRRKDKDQWFILGQVPPLEPFPHLLFIEGAAWTADQEAHGRHPHSTRQLTLTHAISSGPHNNPMQCRLT